MRDDGADVFRREKLMKQYKNITLNLSIAYLIIN